MSPLVNATIVTGVSNHPGFVAPQVLFFPSSDKYADHCRDHFFSLEEPWDRVVGRNALAAARKKWQVGEVLEQEFHDTLARAVEQGVQWSAGVPVFLLVRELVDGHRKRDAALFVAKKGFVVVVDARAVLTAYFPFVAGRDTSAHEYFRQSWKHLQKRLWLREYPDFKGGLHIRILDRIPVAPEHWTACPNPHRKPGVSPHRSSAPWLKQEGM